MAVYFIQHGEGGDIKIGHTSRDPYERMAALQTGTPLLLALLVTVPGGKKEEGELHEKFAALHARGEWFRSDPVLLSFIEGARWAHRESQPKPPEGWKPGEERKDSGPTLCGLTPDQVEGISTYLQMRTLLDEAQAVAGHMWHFVRVGRDASDSCRRISDFLGQIADGHLPTKDVVPEWKTPWWLGPEPDVDTHRGSAR